MKKILILTLGVLVAFNSIAQSSKQVKWTFTAVKKGAEYEVKATAVVGAAYHIYAQDAGSGVGLPTKFKFNKNPLLTLNGAVAEKGKLIIGKEKIGKTTVNIRYYNGTVTFVQMVKAKASSNLSGNVSYMVCNDSGCLPPSTTSFDIKL
jgi:hypothetical protein